jgi:hypothetical protein
MRLAPEMRPVRAPHSRDCGPVSQELFIAITHPHLLLPQSISTPPDPRPPHPHKPLPAAASEPGNRPAMPGSHKHPQERPITDRSGQQYRSEIAAGGHATPEGLPGGNTRRARTLEEAKRTSKDAVAMAIEANRELTPPSCPPPFCHRIYQHPPRICPRSCPVHPNLLPANSLRGGTAGASEYSPYYLEIRLAVRTGGFMG